VRTRDGEEVQAYTADVSAEGVGLVGTSFGVGRDRLHVVLRLPDGSTVTGSGPIVRLAGGLTAVRLSMIEDDGRDRLSAFLLDRQTEAVQQPA
jgi:hypothetical protein